MSYEIILYEVADGMASITSSIASSFSAFHDQMLQEWAEAVWHAWSPHHPAIHALAP